MLNTVKMKRECIQWYRFLLTLDLILFFLLKLQLLGFPVLKNSAIEETLSDTQGLEVV